MWSRYNSVSISKEDVDTDNQTTSDYKEDVDTDNQTTSDYKEDVDTDNQTTSDYKEDVDKDNQTTSVGDPLFSPREGLFQKSRSRTSFSNQQNEAQFLGETSDKNSPLEEDLFSAEEKAKYVKTKVKRIYRFGKGGQVEIDQQRTRPRDII